MGLSLKSVSHAYGNLNVFNNLSLVVAKGEIVSLVGPSGCGKTTLLRVVAGLERLQSGNVSVSGNIIADKTSQIAPEHRGVGLMFQDFALFPHLNVANNVAFGLNNLTSSERESRVHQILHRVSLLRRKDDYPHSLSGGQQQRVALGRALAPKPEVMLLDEPFSGLDQGLRIQIREEILGILKKSKVATLMVTHDYDEAMFMSDRILVMGPTGEIVQEGSPNEVYNLPDHPFVASYFGLINRLSGVSYNELVETPLGVLPAPGCRDGCEIDIIMRPHDIEISQGSIEGVPVEILNVRPLGRDTFIRFRIKNQDSDYHELCCRYTGFFSEDLNDQTRASIQPERVFLYYRNQLIR